ncbi:MAG: type II toxin-antitoxin system VapC family toxin [Caldilineaceae bacterium]
MSNYLLDTGPVLYHFRGKKRAVQLIRQLAINNKLSLSAITRAEVRAGMKPEERFATNKLLMRFITLDVDREIADRAGEIIGSLHRQGLTIGLPDALIAATAITYNLTLVTYNRAHFEIVHGVSLYPIIDDN